MLVLEVKLRGTRLEPLGYEQITVSTPARGFDIPASGGRGEVYAIFIVETDAVRYRDDGVDPTASVGMLLNEGDCFAYDGDLSKLKVIRVNTDAVLNISYYA